jgi:cytochrome c551/c552
VVRGGRCTRVDEDAVLAAADEVAAASRRDSAAAFELAARERPAFAGPIHAALRRPAPMERFARLG